MKVDLFFFQLPQDSTVVVVLPKVCKLTGTNPLCLKYGNNPSQPAARCSPETNTFFSTRPTCAVFFYKCQCSRFCYLRRFDRIPLDEIHQRSDAVVIVNLPRGSQTKNPPCQATLKGHEHRQASKLFLKIDTAYHMVSGDMQRLGKANLYYVVNAIVTWWWVEDAVMQ